MCFISHLEELSRLLPGYSYWLLFVVRMADEFPAWVWKAIFLWRHAFRNAKWQGYTILLRSISVLRFYIYDSGMVGPAEPGPVLAVQLEVCLIKLKRAKKICGGDWVVRMCVTHLHEVIAYTFIYYTCTNTHTNVLTETRGLLWMLRWCLTWASISAFANTSRELPLLSSVELWSQNPAS